MKFKPEDFYLLNGFSEKRDVAEIANARLDEMLADAAKTEPWALLAEPRRLLSKVPALHRENQSLRELLREAREMISSHEQLCGCEEQENCIKRIDDVLGDK